MTHMSEDFPLTWHTDDSGVDRKMNPKHIRAQKEGKDPMEYLIWEVLMDDAVVHKHGADKYGVRNWRIDEILTSTYEGAIMRHFLAWAKGEDIDPDSGKPHLTHIRACCAIIMDAQAHGKLVDDRDRKESKNDDTETDDGNAEGNAPPDRPNKHGCMVLPREFLRRVGRERDGIFWPWVLRPEHFGAGTDAEDNRSGTEGEGHHLLSEDLQRDIDAFNARWGRG